MKNPLFRGVYLTIVTVWVSMALIFPHLSYPMGWLMYLLPLLSGVIIVLKSKDRINPSLVLTVLAGLTPVIELIWGRVYDIPNLFDPKKTTLCFNYFGQSSYILFAIVIPVYVHLINVIISKRLHHQN